ncbi:hypothetical protein WS105_0634 [Weissella ceti]|uniref:hypothetical protein n=1 Tax=Weissella ceti TaxID=759620 RepID=UPI0004F75390|nr:hypothetical protein [Weissella ceti]AIM64224.1 hypothetical protein WS105_0634 [Weissella ceti]
MTFKDMKPAGRIVAVGNHMVQPLLFERDSIDARDLQDEGVKGWLTPDGDGHGEEVWITEKVYGESLAGTNLYTEEQVRDTFLKPVEMNEAQSDFIKDHIDMGDNIEDGMHFWRTNGLFFGVLPEDMMRAWLHPELIKVVDE